MHNGVTQGNGAPDFLKIAGIGRRRIMKVFWEAPCYRVLRKTCYHMLRTVRRFGKVVLEK